ncbi:MAG: ATP-binding cassette domain-containing protein [Gammaproteobacteria bacterium]
MSLLTLRSVYVSFGGPLILDHVDLQIDPGERVCLIGRNGEGKSTLLKLIANQIHADDGEMQKQQGLKVACLEQEVPDDANGTIYDVVATGLGEQGDLLSRYHRLTQEIAKGSPGSNEKKLNELEQTQRALESAGGWRVGQRVEKILSRLKLPADDLFESLSGGFKRRVLLAKALVAEPELLLLDEPTNHLDMDAILWMEEFLTGFKGAILFITHDRMLLQRLATRIIELDRGLLTSWPGDYQNYLRRKQAALDAEATKNALFDKKLAEEERWIRQGIKARRTRNEGRVRALKQMREKRGERRNRVGKARMDINDSILSGKLVIEANDVSYAYNSHPVIKGFSTLILRGDKIGIIGPNGVGKTTLLNLLLGKLDPQSGEIRQGTKLEITYFDQLRAQLDEEKSVLDNVADGSDKVTINGNTRHVISYLQDFLFSPQRVRTPVKALSGGERNRLLLARLFTRPANLMVMDEPTNDLDMETLELLEELLVEFKGTLILVSHDRAFINNVVTSTLVFEGKGKVGEYVGGYDDWLRQRKMEPTSLEKEPKEKANKVRKGSRENTSKKLSYKDQRELNELPATIEALESEQQQLHDVMASPSFYQRDSQLITADKSRLENLEQELEKAYRRWEQLEDG